MPEFDHEPACEGHTGRPCQLTDRVGGLEAEGDDHEARLRRLEEAVASFNELAKAFAALKAPDRIVRLETQMKMVSLAVGAIAGAVLGRLMEMF